MAFLRGGLAVKEVWIIRHALRHADVTATRTLCSETRDIKRYSTNKLNRRIKDTANAVIVGGGALGTATAYHLAKAGMKDVVLLEKTELTAGSTWHAAGLTTYYQAIVNMKKITLHSLKLYGEIARETGQQVGFHRPGSIRLAKVPERVDEFRYQMHRHGSHADKIPQRIVWPDEIQQLHPLINVDKILAGLYMEGDGHIDPYSLTQAYAIGARKYGAEIYQHSPVLGLKQTSDGKWDVETQHGTIRANHVVNAAGFWSREVGKMVGLDIPVLTVEHQYVVTASIPEVQAQPLELPVLRDLEGSYYVRQERTGLLIGPYEPAENMKMRLDWLDGVPPGFGRELFESDLDRIAENLEAAMELMPVLQTADIQTVLNGPMAFSPDSIGVVGPQQGLQNFWMINGVIGGIVWSAGLANYLAEWMINGEPPHDLIELDPARYGKWTTRDYLIAKITESYALNNLVGYPFEERHAGRPTERTSTAYQRMKERGAIFGHHGGWEQPNWFALPGDDASYKPSFYRTNWFEPVGRECKMVTERAGIIDLTPLGKFEIRGKDAEKLLDFLCACDLPQVGECKIAHMLTPSGKIYAELAVCKLADDRFFCINGAQAELHDIRWIEDHAFQGNFDVQITNITDDRACLGIAGPKSREILQQLTSTDLSHGALLPMGTKNFTVDGVDVFAIRASSTGELGYELYHDRKHTAKLYDTLLTAGDSFGIGDFGSYAVNAMRLEKGYRAWGRELTIDYNPYEAGLEEFLSPEKEANFIGKQTLPTLQENLSRKLVLLSVDCGKDNLDPIIYESVWSNGKVVGSTTSGAYSYSTKQSIAYAYLPLDLTSVGSKVEVEMMGNHYAATVIQEPIVESDSRSSPQKNQTVDEEVSAMFP
ncbi:dimethylglycine dehydrogenase, mitochondrial-like [Ptychodera flava]|uniref:dimethylglycine dehydrogenase, mitochondrial-like n=1 Tax=Ptychodera flava TaxID=63121 RepID=UPI003969F1F3